MHAMLFAATALLPHLEAIVVHAGIDAVFRSNRGHVECTPFLGLLKCAFFNKLSPVLNWTHL